MSIDGGSSMLRSIGELNSILPATREALGLIAESQITVQAS